MQLKKLSHFFLVGCFMLAAFLVHISTSAQDNLKNAPELSLPLVNKKLVIAHCMTNIIRYKDHPLEDGCNSAYYETKNNATSSIGGYTQVKPLEDEWQKDATLEEAVEFQMRAALKAGIDGFQFYYTLGSKKGDEIIKAYFLVADKKNIDFKLTLCISHPSGSTEDKKIAEFAERINGIFKEVGRNNSHWLRTPDGRLIVYLWYGEQLAAIPENKKALPDAYYAAKAFEKLGLAIEEKLACIYLVNENISNKKLNEYLDYFPAVWIWTLAWNKNYIGNKVAAACKERGRTFTGSVFGDFYTSKILKPGTWEILNAKEAVAAGVNNIERKALVTGLSFNFRKLLEFNIKQDVSLMNVITWNDYPEGHHLAPEDNHNDGFSVLLQHYKSIWKKEVSPYAKKNVALVFFKKYRHNILPQPYHIPLVLFQKGSGAAGTEDVIEVITILPDKAQLSVNDKTVDMSAGLSSTYFNQQEGKVNITVSRNKEELLHFVTPVNITNHPLRTDRLTYSYTSETELFYKDLFQLVRSIQQSNSQTVKTGLQ